MAGGELAQEGEQGQPSPRHSLLPRPSGVGHEGLAVKGKWSGRREEPRGCAAPWERSPGARGRQRRRRAALRSHSCLRPVPLAQAVGGQPPQTGQLTRVSGCLRRRTEGVLPQPTGAGAGQEQGIRDSDGGQEPAWSGASLRGGCRPRSEKHQGVLLPNPLPGFLSSKRSQGTTVIAFH